MPAPPPAPVEWFYMDLQDVQQGPTNEAGVQRLYAMGDIHDFTYVWNESMDGWKTLKDAGLLGAAQGGDPAASAHAMRHAFV